MSRSDVRIEAYLARVSAALASSTPARTDVLDELRDHLYQALADERARGLDDEAAIDVALARMGPPSKVAASFVERPDIMTIATAAYAYLAIVLGGVLVTIGVSGIVAAPLGLLFGPEFISGDAPIEPLGLDRCVELARYHPGASDCAAAWSQHLFEESVVLRIVPGLLGLIVIAIHLLLLRRLRLSGLWTDLPAKGAALASLTTSLLVSAGLAVVTASAFGDPAAFEGVVAAAGGPSHVGAGWWMSVSAGTLAAAAVSATVTRALFRSTAAPA